MKAHKDFYYTRDELEGLILSNRHSFIRLIEDESSIQPKPSSSYKFAVKHYLILKKYMKHLDENVFEVMAKYTPHLFKIYHGYSWNIKGNRPVTEKEKWVLIYQKILPELKLLYKIHQQPDIKSKQLSLF